MPIIRSPFDLPAGRLLGLDIGEVRLGVAVCDEMGWLATPLTVLRRRPTRAADFAALADLARQQKAVGLLVGLPLDRQGEMGPQARRVRRYTGYLAQALALPVAFWDESYSTADAAGLLLESGGRTAIDAAAAAVILGNYLEARRTKRSDRNEGPADDPPHNTGGETAQGEDW
jgi:putative holliday junction resolvase